MPASVQHKTTINEQGKEATGTELERITEESADGGDLGHDNQNDMLQSKRPKIAPTETKDKADNDAEMQKTAALPEDEGRKIQGLSDVKKAEGPMENSDGD